MKKCVPEILVPCFECVYWAASQRLLRWAKTHKVRGREEGELEHMVSADSQVRIPAWAPRATFCHHGETRGSRGTPGAEFSGILAAVKDILGTTASCYWEGL